MAKSIVQCLRDMAATGKTIVCTIHQPSTTIFNLFDQLVFLRAALIKTLSNTFGIN